MALQDQVTSGLEQLLLSPDQQQAMQQQLLQRSLPDILRQYGNKAQDINESAFGRGMGLSTVNAYAQAQNMQAQKEAEAKAAIDAQMASRQAQAAALGQAASYLTAQQSREQQANQFQQSLSQQKKGLKAQQAGQTQAMLGQLGGGLGGAALGAAGRIWGPDLKSLLKGGGGSPGAPGAGVPYSPGEGNPASPGEAGGGLGEGGPNADTGFSMPDFSGGSTDMPSLDFGNYDFGGSGGATISPDYNFDFGNLDFGNMFSGGGNGLEDLFNWGEGW